MNVVIWGLGTNGKNFIDVWGEQNVVAIVESNMVIRNTGEYKIKQKGGCKKMISHFFISPIY